MRPSLASQLTFRFGASAFLIVLAATGYLYFALASALHQQNAQILADKIRALKIMAEWGPSMRPFLKHRIEVDWATREFERVYARVIDSEQNVISASPAISPRLDRILNEARVIESPECVVRTKRLTEELAEKKVLARTCKVKSGSDDWLTIQIALDCSSENDLLYRYRSHIYLMLFLSVLISAVVGWRTARRGMWPIYAIARTAATINSSNLHERIRIVDLPVELSSLAHTFNQMLDRLENSFRRLSQFSADIAHELRTPIGNILGELEVTLGKIRSQQAYQDALGSCLEECERLSKIIDSLLFLAHSENPTIQLKKERVSLAHELQMVLDFYEASAAEVEIHCRLQAQSGIFVDVERTLFQRAVGNLLANSIKHTPVGGTIEISVSQRDAEVVIRVADSGCGIPPAQLPFVFDRFYRVDGSRSQNSGGSGLGLAIVKTIATIHGGRVQMKSEPGLGTQVDLHLPG